MLPIETTPTELRSEGLPFASGGYIGVDCNFYGAKKKRGLDNLVENGFKLIPFKKGESVALQDDSNCLLAIRIGGPDDSMYFEDVEDMMQAVLEKGRTMKWEAKEKRHKRGSFPAVAQGISYGKGQPEPMHMNDKRQGMMEELMSRSSVCRIAGYQSAAFARWFPRHYQDLRHQNSQLKEKLPHLEPNFTNSIFSSMTVNFGPSTWTYIHTDAKNDITVPCAITSGGNYNWELGGHLVLWDFKVILEFPPGATILLPSALLCHSNIPVQAAETCVSVTQYTAGGIQRRLEYGGRTADAFASEDPDGYAKIFLNHNDVWKKSLAKFCTLDELKSGQW
ncbi:hypothetical protein GYMLUDRAFT_235893 [Collybiopsis luxurians FD-317 M1]|nr:hypothetical protein GYMLUDRAFT_235893 [Collybiopsis luxurians FD-317 M1]